jgi:hypothetical protein
MLVIPHKSRHPRDPARFSAISFAVPSGVKAACEMAYFRRTAGLRPAHRPFSCTREPQLLSCASRNVMQQGAKVDRMPADKTDSTRLDVVIVGAGVGGLFAVYRLRTETALRRSRAFRQISDRNDRGTFGIL